MLEAHAIDVRSEWRTFSDSVRKQLHIHVQDTYKINTITRTFARSEAVCRRVKARPSKRSTLCVCGPRAAHDDMTKTLEGHLWFLT